MDRHSGLEAAASGQMIVWGDDDGLVESRSYRCSFCKRGFSNAQALGGHMNIHRKDRAKLKEFSCENMLSLDSMMRSCPDCEEGSPSKDKLIGSESGHPKRDHKESNRDHKHEEKRKQTMRYGELDLELRLGPEPHHDTKSNT